MPIKVKADFSGMNKRFSESRLAKAHLAATNQAYTEMNKFVPSSSKGKNEGKATLRGDSVISSDGSKIIYSQPYAKAQFYGFITNKYGGPFKVHHYTTPGTGKRWDLMLKADKHGMDTVKKAFCNVLKGEY